MIIRIVKLTFKENCVSDFLQLFEELSPQITSFEGCRGLSLQREIDKNVFFTISRWRSIEDLERYRKSSLFKNNWPHLKLLFSEKPLAFSTQQVWEKNIFVKN